MTNRYFTHTRYHLSKKVVTEIDLMRVGDVYYDEFTPNTIYVYVYGREIKLDVDPEEFIAAWKSFNE